MDILDDTTPAVMFYLLTNQVVRQFLLRLVQHTDDPPHNVQVCKMMSDVRSSMSKVDSINSGAISCAHRFGLVYFIWKADNQADSLQ